MLDNITIDSILSTLSQGCVSTAATAGSVVNYSGVVLGASIDAYCLVRELGTEQAELQAEQMVAIAVNAALGRKS